MGIEYKSVAVGGVTEVKDEGDGVVTAYVSLTGVEDNVKDIIEPGGYEETLNKRTPKGVWGHQWLTPTSKTLDAKELMPGDPDLPKKLSDGTPWPKEAGALRIKMQFNLGTRRGREAYSDVQFFGDQQEWSIGYVVPEGGAYKDAKGVRHIKKLDLFEYSPVLFGAMSHARTASVKDAQVGLKLLEGVSALEIKSLEDAVAMYRKEHGADDPVDAADADDFEGDDLIDVELEEDDEVEEEEVEDDSEEEKALIRALSSKMTLNELRNTHILLGKVLDIVDPLLHGGVPMEELGYKALIEAKAIGFDSITEAVDAIDVSLDPSDAKSLRESAGKLDLALKAGDNGAAEESATNLMDVLEKVMSDNEDNDVSLKTVARTIADKTASPDDEEDDEDEEYSEDDEEDEEDEPASSYKKKHLPFTAANGVEYKSVPFAGREFGTLAGGEDLSAGDRKRAFIGTLPNDALLALEYVLGDMPGNLAEKTYVKSEIEDRIFAGVMSREEKNGQQGRGGGRMRQAREGRLPGQSDNFGNPRVTKKPAGKRLRKAAKGIKKPGRTTKTVNRVTGRSKPIKQVLGEKRYFGTDERQAAAKRGEAMPDGSYPIKDRASLKDAIQAIGRAKDPDAVKAHIKKRAKALGCSDLIPDSWKTAVIDTTELKSLEAFVNGVS